MAERRTGDNRVQDVRAVDTVARHEPGRGVVHLEGRTVRAADFEPAEAAFEIGEELAERRVVVTGVIVPVVTERKRREDTGDHAIVERAFGVDVDVARDELDGGVGERHATEIIGIDQVEAGRDRAADRDGQRIARERRTGDHAGRDESSRPKENLFHVFLAVSAKSCSIRTSHRKYPPWPRPSPGRLKLPPERVTRLIR